VSHALGKTVISLPMHPYIDEQTLETIIGAILQCVEKAS
jgi:dTDP-4-amino-4,6-dideoxygalactose transaminase